MLNLELLDRLLVAHREAYNFRVAEFDIGGKFLSFNTKPAVMGVINLSADSWYRESVCLSVEKAVQRGKILIDQGANIVDIGAESTILSAARVEESLQKSKLLPVIKELRSLNIPVSVESYSYEVICECLNAGANLINLTGTYQTEEIYRVISDFNAGVIICYVEGKNVREVGDYDFSKDPIDKMAEYFSKEIERALKSGVNKIFIDPGLGFYYKNLQDSSLRIRYQMETFLNTFRLRKLGYPICHALPHAFEYFCEEVRSAEPFFAVLAMLGKTDLFRTHEVPKIKAVLSTMDLMK
ncbi:MAG: dihydropteroate synthase [Verrucomicrobiia bacterium]